MRTSGSTAPAVLLAFCLLAVVFQRGTSALAVVPLLGAVVPLCAGCEDNGWLFLSPIKGGLLPQWSLSFELVFFPHC